MSGTATNGAVYQLITQLTEVPDQQNDGVDNNEEREEPLSPDEEPTTLTKSLDDFESMVESQSKNEVSTRLIDYRQRKRTTITPSQKAILEEFYVGGMTSSGMQFSALHHAAAQKTGLSVHSIQLWIRNRRRPVCRDKSPLTNHKPLDASFSTIARAISSLPANDNMATSSPLYLTDGSTDHIKNCYQSSETSPVPSQLAVTEITHAAILVKCRIANSSEEDFVEVEVPSLTYAALLQSCCEELEVESSTVAKIRKLPNTLVRKDKDVMRLSSLQELELVLHTALVHT